MSSTIRIRSEFTIVNFGLAQKAIEVCGSEHIWIEDNTFAYNKERYSSNANEDRCYEQVLSTYIELLNEYNEKIAEEERLRIEKDKEIKREKKLAQIAENAKKCGYQIKKTVKANKKIQLVLVKRTY